MTESMRPHAPAAAHEAATRIGAGGELARDAGLVRAVGPVSLTANVINSVIGAGVFVVPSAMAAAVGGYAPWAIVLCGVAMGAVVACFAEGGRRVPTSGGPYGYILLAFGERGPLIAAVTGTLMWIGNVLSTGALTAAFADAVATLVPSQLAAPSHAAAILGSLAAVAAINIRGARWGARLVGLFTFAKLVPLLVFLIAGVVSLHGVPQIPATQAPSLEGFGRAMILSVYAFTGCEIALGASGEVTNPSRTIPLAIASGMIFIAGLYIGVQIIAAGLLGDALAGSPAPLADAVGKIHPALRGLLLAGASLSMFGYVVSDLLGTPRLLFAFARDGRLPAVLGRVHPRTHAPHAAIIAYAGVAAVLALTGTFTELLVIATLTASVLYIGVCGAVWVLVRSDRAAPDGSARRMLLQSAAAVGIGSMLLMIALASWQEIAGTGALILASALLFTFYRARYAGMHAGTR